MSVNDLTWWTEYARARGYLPHSPRRMQSIASSSPINLWECPRCHRTQLALRPPECEGGYESSVTDYGAAYIFANREHNLRSAPRIARYERERGSDSVLSYHISHIRGNGRR